MSGLVAGQSETERESKAKREREGEMTQKKLFKSGFSAEAARGR